MHAVKIGNWSFGNWEVKMRATVHRRGKRSGQVIGNSSKGETDLMSNKDHSGHVGPLIWP